MTDIRQTWQTWTQEEPCLISTQQQNTTKTKYTVSVTIVRASPANNTLLQLLKSLQGRKKQRPKLRKNVISASPKICPSNLRVANVGFTWFYRHTKAVLWVSLSTITNTWWIMWTNHALPNLHASNYLITEIYRTPLKRVVAETKWNNYGTVKGSVCLFRVTPISFFCGLLSRHMWVFGQRTGYLFGWTLIFPQIFEHKWLTEGAHNEANALMHAGTPWCGR